MNDILFFLPNTANRAGMSETWKMLMWSIWVTKWTHIPDYYIFDTLNDDGENDDHHNGVNKIGGYEGGGDEGEMSGGHERVAHLWYTWHAWLLKMRRNWRTSCIYCFVTTAYYVEQRTLLR